MRESKQRIATYETLDMILGMLNVSGAQQLTMQNAVNQLQLNLKKTIDVLKFDRFYADAKWKTVEEMAVVEYPYKDIPMVYVN